LILVIARGSLDAFAHAVHQPWWILLGSERIALHWPRLLGIGLLAAGAGLSLRK
jgi:hypothetical protein